MAPSSSSRRIQGIFVCCLVLLGACGGIGGMLLLLQWRSDRALPLMADQGARLLSESLLSRQRNVEILRDTLEKAPGLSEQERRKILESASTRIPGLVANGWMEDVAGFAGWTSPDMFSSNGEQPLFRDAMRQSRLRRFFGWPTTLLLPHKGRMLLVFVQPVRTSSPPQTLISAVELRDLLSELRQPGTRGLPFQVTQQDRLLYRSPDWAETAPGEAPPASLQRTIRFGEAAWLLEVQSHGTPWLSAAWFNALTLAVGLLAGAAFSGMSWSILRLRQLATTDELTELGNRRSFMERWREEVERAKRYHRDLSCLVIDVNGFKQINDRAGHLIGDQVLREVARKLGGQLRKTDILARYGGDEFIVALPETRLDQAETVAEKLRATDFEGAGSPVRARVGPVTLSVGAAQIQADDSAFDAIERADQNLYASRRAAPISKIIEWAPKRIQSVFP